MVKDGRVAIPFPYEAGVHRCFGCETIEETKKHLEREGAKGATIYLKRAEPDE